MMRVTIGGDLENVVNKLIKIRNDGFNVYTEFKGHILYSSNVTLDSAYLEVTGMTYREYMEKRRRMLEEWEKEEKQEKEKIKKNRIDWIYRGYKLIPEKLWDDWEHYIDARIEELYRGEEIEHALQIMEAHASGMSTEEIYEFIISQNYSGNVLITLKTIIAYFYPKGLELIEEISELKNGRTK